MNVLYKHKTQAAHLVPNGMSDRVSRTARKAIRNIFRVAGYPDYLVKTLEEFLISLKALDLRKVTGEKNGNPF